MPDTAINRKGYRKIGCGRTGVGISDEAETGHKLSQQHRPVLPEGMLEGGSPQERIEGGVVIPGSKSLS
jgi:hypothetical protein